jgi:lysophospholipase L1-like esterase
LSKPALSAILISVKDTRLTQIFFKALEADPSLANFDEWHHAGDFACEMRFFPHALACYQRAAQLNRNEMTLIKINNLIDKITNVLEFVPAKLRPLIEDIRLSNPLDPAKWLAIANGLLKELTEKLQHNDLDTEFFSACRFALAFAAYTSARSGADITPINSVLADLLDEVNLSEFKTTQRTLKQLFNKDQIKIVVLGDQISLGLQEDFEIKFRETYHYLWSKNSKANISLANNSVSGAGVLDLALYLGRDLIYYKPDLVLINFGLNDIWLGSAIGLAFEVLLEECLLILQAHNIKPLIVSPAPHIPSAYPDEQRPNTISDEDADINILVDACKRVAMRTGVLLVDASDKFPSQESELKKFFANGYNILNLEGHKLIQEALSETIQTQN